MFVTCRKNVKFTNSDNPKVSWAMKPGFIGEIPTWVEKSWYFAKLCADGSITAIVSKRDRDVQDVVEGGENNSAAATLPPVPPVTPAPDDGEGELKADEQGSADDPKETASKGRGKTAK
jgi:hypothetical protein